MREWGVADPDAAPGGLGTPAPDPAPRQVYLLQRKTSKVGAGLGKTSGWVHRAALTARGVESIRGVTYERIDDDGLHLTVGGRSRVLAVDDVVDLRRAGVAARARRAVAGGGRAGPPDRRRRPRGRARRQARDRPGHPARRDPLNHPQPVDQLVDGRCTTAPSRGITRPQLWMAEENRKTRRTRGCAPRFAAVELPHRSQEHRTEGDFGEPGRAGDRPARYVLRVGDTGRTSRLTFGSAGRCGRGCDRGGASGRHRGGSRGSERQSGFGRAVELDQVGSAGRPPGRRSRWPAGGASR